MPTAPTRRRPWAILFWAAVTVFLLLALDLLLHGPISTADPASSNWLHQRQHPVLTAAMQAITTLHSTRGIIAISAAMAALLLFTRRYRDALALFVTVQGGQVFNAMAKHVFNRPRPHFDEPLVSLSTASFPSGHAAGTTVLWGFACVLVLRSDWPAGARRAFAVLALAMVAITCFSRMYLGAHYLADVLAGTALGLAWLSFWQWMFLRQRRA